MTVLVLLSISLLGFSATATAAPAQSLTGCPMLTEGDTGPCVSMLQRMLTKVHPEYNLPGSQTFGPKTRIALLDFQGRNHLGADGELGPRTAEELQRQYEGAGGGFVSSPRPQPKTATGCADGSRKNAEDIAARGDFVEYDPETIRDGGSLGTTNSSWNTELVLRYSSSAGCAWGLVKGYSSETQVWIDRWVDGAAKWNGPLGKTGLGYRNEPAANGATAHTPAYRTDNAKVRACTQTWNGAYRCTGWH